MDIWNMPFFIKIKSKLENVIDRLIPPASVEPKELHSAMRYSVLNGGKRIRGVMLAMVSNMLGGRDKDSINAGSAIEIFHAYTLVHDDLPCMDNDDTRRGKPSCHKVYGEANAILCGDALQALSFEVLAGCFPVRRWKPSDLVIELAKAASTEGVVGGQYDDLRYGSSLIDIDMISDIHRRKTGKLFSAVLKIGVMLAGRSEKFVNIAGKIGLLFGQAFQIVDDISDSIKSGKEVNCLSAISADQAYNEMLKLIVECRKIIKKTDIFKILEPFIEWLAVAGKDELLKYKAGKF